VIYITGDTHIPIDIKKLNTSNFAEQHNMTKNDYVIICGDFGGVWNNSNEELYWRKWLQEKNFTTLFVDGNHENFDMLNQFPVSQWNGGNVHYINDSIIHLMRGQVFTIDDFKFFTMGGAESIDKAYRVEGKSWWKEELPTNDQFEEALDNLDIHNWSVDYVITHTASMRIMEHMQYIKENNPLYGFLNRLEEDLQYKHWYFGHFHADIDINDKHTLLYDRIIKL
jgi:predicted phosphodiesterase